MEEQFAQRLRLEPLAALRDMRKALREEERDVSYWRRLVQGRIDLARAALAGDQPTISRLASRITAQERAEGRRSPSFARFADGGGDHRLAQLADLWESPIPWDDPERLRSLGPPSR